jgi:hypothetical protein
LGASCAASADPCACNTRPHRPVADLVSVVGPPAAVVLVPNGNCITIAWCVCEFQDILAPATGSSTLSKVTPGRPSAMGLLVCEVIQRPSESRACASPDTRVMVVPSASVWTSVVLNTTAYGAGNLEGAERDAAQAWLRPAAQLRRTTAPARVGMNSRTPRMPLS